MDIKRTVVRLVVGDFKSTFRFYRNTIGLPVDFGTEDDNVAEFDAGTVILTVVDRSVMSELAAGQYRPAGSDSGDRCVVVMQVSDFDTAVRELKSRGAEGISDPVPVPDWHMRIVHLRDPEGNLLEIQSTVE